MLTAPTAPWTCPYCETLTAPSASDLSQCEDCVTVELYSHLTGLMSDRNMGQPDESLRGDRPAILDAIDSI